MPLTLTPEQEARKDAYIRSKGLDPAVVDFDLETRSFVPRVAAQTEETATPIVEPSPLQTGLKSAAYHLPEAGGGLAGAGTGALLGSSFGPIGTLVGALGGGFGGSTATRWLKEKALNNIPFVHRAAESIGLSPEQMAVEEATNPKAALAGELSSNLPFFNLSGGVRGIAQAGRGLRTLASGSMRMPAAQAASLGNVALGTALGAGQSIGGDLASGQDIDWKNAAMQTIAGMLLNDPTKLGTLASLGQFHKLPTDKTVELFDAASRLARGNKSLPAEKTSPPPGIRAPAEYYEMTMKGEAPDLAANVLNARTGSRGMDIPYSADMRPPKPDAESAYENLIQLPKKPYSYVPEGGKVPYGYVKGGAETINLQEKRPASVLELARAEIGQDITRPEVRPENPVDRTMDQATPGRTAADDTQARLESTRERYSPAGEISFRADIKRKEASPFDIALEDPTAVAPRPKSSLPPGLVAAAKYLGDKKYETDVITSAEPMVTAHAQEGVPAGTPIRGKNSMRDGDPTKRSLITLSERLGLPDTPAHELLEGLLGDMEDHGSKSEKNFVARLREAFGGKLDDGIDAAASDVTQQLLNPKQTSLLKDLGTLIRYKTGRASPGELARIAANTLRYGAGSKEILAGVRGAGAAPKAGSEKERYRAANMITQDGADYLYKNLLDKPGKVKTKKIEERIALLEEKIKSAKTQDVAAQYREEQETLQDVLETLKNEPPIENLGVFKERYSPAQEGTPEFQKWFKDSKIVTPDGKPLVVYHGTPVLEPINKFDTNKRGYTYGKGTYFTPEKERAAGYADKYSSKFDKFQEGGEAGPTYPVYLSIKNPFRTPSDAGVTDLAWKLQRDNLAHYKELTQLIAKENGYSSAEAVGTAEVGNALLREQGYDGIIKEWKYNDPLEIVAFYPEQIKSATGNSGAFSRDNPDIRYSPVKNEESKVDRYTQYFDEMKKLVDAAEPTTPSQEQRPLPPREPARDGSAQHVNWRERYSPATSERFGQIENPDEVKERDWSFFRPLTEKLAKSGDPLKEQFAVKYLDLVNEQRALSGKWQNGMLDAIGKLSNAERNHLYEVLIDEGRQKQDLSATLNPKEAAAREAFRAVYNEMGQNRLDAGQMVGGRAGGVDPLGMFEVIDRDVMRILLEHPGTPQYDALRADFIKHSMDGGLSQEAAEKKFNTLLGHFNDAKNLESNFKFNAVRTPEGVGLPDSWIEKDFASAIRRYTRRFATDRAFFDQIEKNPRLMSALGADHMANGAAIPAEHASELKIAGDPSVRALLATYVGADMGVREPLHSSLGRFVNSLILGGPITKLTDLGSVPFHALRYVRPQDVPGLLASMANWRQGYLDAFTTGLNRRGGLVVATEILGAHEQAARALDKAAEFVTKVTGSEQLELLSRGLAQAMGHFIGKTQRALAMNGNTHAIDFLKKLGSDWETASPEELGTRVAKLMQGRYDATNLPSWMRNSPIAPFFSMMRWSVEQWNNFRNFAVEPARKGDMTPMAMTMIGALAGGTVLNAMRQELSGRKAYIASDEELAQAKAVGAPGYNKENIYRWIAAANVTGSFGIVGEFLRQAYDASVGKTPQGFNYPVWGVAKDVITRGASAYAAIQDGEDPANVAMQYAKDISKNNIQIVRILANQYAKHVAPEGALGQELTYKNQRRDVAMFNSLYGYPANKSPREFPEYKTLSERAFDKERDPQRAGTMAQQLIQRAVGNAQGNPEILRSNLRRLRTAPNLTMPSQQNDPVRFAQYIQFVEKTQGPEKAKALLRQYYESNALRQAKTAMVPSL